MLFFCKSVIFSVHNNTAVDWIKRRCKSEVDLAIAEYKPGFKPVFVARLPLSPAGREKEIEFAMSSAAAINVESAERARLKEERILKAREEARKMREEHDAAYAAYQETLTH